MAERANQPQIAHKKISQRRSRGVSPLPGSRCIHSQPRSLRQRTYRPASSRPLSVRLL